MIPFDGPAQTQIATGNYGVCWLIEMDFESGTQYLTTWAYDLPTNGHTYQGLGGLSEVANLSESGDTHADKLSLSLSIIDTGMVALAMGAPSTYRFRRARLYLQLLDDKDQPIGAAKLRWAGFMDKMQISRKAADPVNGDGSSGKITMVCARAGMAKARRNEGIRLTDQQQQALYPGDTGYRYIRNLIEYPTMWLSKAFQTV